MKHILFFGMVIALFILSALPVPAHSGEAPSFLQAGKAYNMVIGGAFNENVYNS